VALRFEDGGGEEESIVAEINITPLTDLFLVLLIIFMISSSAMLEGGMPVKLPAAKSSTVNAQSTVRPVYVTVSGDGSVRVDDKAIPSQALEEALKLQLAERNEKTVIIRGDETIDLGKAVQVMDAARVAGADRIAIATQPPK
jgi:biopolymer transport protein ExbD